MSDWCPIIWHVLHDAIITRLEGAVPGDLRLELDCDYLRDRFKNPGNRFFLTLRSCSRFAYIPWSDESQLIVDFDTLAKRRLWILSVDTIDGWCKVHCNEAIVDGNGGSIEVAATAIELRLDDGVAVSLDELKNVAREYWDEWASSGGTPNERF